MPKGVSPADFERFTTEIYAFYAEAEQALLAKVARRLARGITEPGWAEAKLAEVQALRAETLKALEHLRAGDEQAARAVLEAYKDGSAQAVYDLEELLRTKGLPNGQQFVKMALPRVNQDTVHALARKLVDGLQATQLKVLRDTEDVFRQAIAAGQRVSQFKGAPNSDVGRQAVAESVGKGMVTGAMNRREATQDVLNRFADRGITGFVDKAGRNWDLASYAEMAVRSATGQASIQGHMDKLLEHGYELFIVSDSPEECEVCRPWERAVLAATEEAMQRARAEGIPVRATVAQAIAAGLFHPNCTHRLGAYIHGLTEDVNTGSEAPDAYEDRQHQRYLERQVRRWKRREAVAMTPEAQRAARQKVNEYQARIRLFIQGPAAVNDPRVKEHGWRVATRERTRRNDREQVRKGEAGKLPPRPKPPLAPTAMPPVPQAQPFGWKEFDTKEAAMEWAERHYLTKEGRADSWDSRDFMFGAADTDFLNRVNKAMADIYAHVDMRKLAFFRAQPNSGDAYAFIDETAPRITIGDKFKDKERDIAILRSRLAISERLFKRQAEKGGVYTPEEFEQAVLDHKSMEKTLESMVKKRFDHYPDHSAYAFEDALDAVVRHEMGHVFHALKKVEIDAAFGERDFEDAAPEQYRVTRRAADNWTECIAENFALYSAGKLERLHPDMIEFFRRVTRWKW